MRYFLAVLSLAVLLFIGCSADDDDPAITALPGGVRFVTAFPDTVLNALYSWELSDPAIPCSWELRQLQVEALSALVAVDVPGGFESAQLLYAYNSPNYFQDMGEELDSLPNPFPVSFTPELRGRPSELSDDTVREWVCVRVTGRDGSHWLSPVIELKLHTAVFPPLGPLPTAPRLDSLFERLNTNTSYLYFIACRTDPRDVDYLVYCRNEFNQQTTVDTFTYGATSGTFSATVPYYLPLTAQAVWVKVATDSGVSPASDTLRLVSGPPAPIHLGGDVAYPSGLVSIWYSGIRQCDSLHVQRRESLSDWTTLFSYPARNSFPTGWIDSSAVSGHEYFYRVGSEFPNGIFWSADSLRIVKG